MTAIVLNYLRHPSSLEIQPPSLRFLQHYRKKMHKIPMPTAADITRMTYDGAEKLRREQRSGAESSKLDFGTVPTCFNCDLPIMGRKVRPSVPIPAYH